MKKINLLLTVIIITTMFSSIVTADEEAYLMTTLMKYEPQPAEPGKYVKVYIKIENVGIKTAENVVLEIIPEYPFSLDPGKKNKETIGMLGGKSFHIVEFNLKVDEAAVQGTNTFKVKYNLDKAQTAWAEKRLELNVQTKNAVLTIKNINTEPKELIPGSEGTIKFNIQNMADSALSNIIINMDLSGDNIPFAPMNSASEKNIYQIKIGETKEVEFKIIAYPNADSGIYKIPLSITYNDNIGTEYSKEDLVGIIINSNPELKVVVDSTTLLSEKSTGEVILKIINKGLSDVKFLNLKITETNDYEILTPTNEEYIGNLDSDDFETVEFRMILKATDKVEIPLTLTYMDSNNKEYSQELMLNLKIHSAEKLGQKQSKSGWIIVLVIILVAGFFVYRRRKKKKQQKSN